MVHPDSGRFFDYMHFARNQVEYLDLGLIVYASKGGTTGKSQG